MLSLGIALPVCRFLIPLTIGAGTLLPGHPFAWGFCSVINRRFAAGNVSPLVEGIKAEEENKEFI
jgi:hypothetical protein